MKTLGVIIGALAVLSLFMVIGLSKHAMAVDPAFKQCMGCHKIEQGKRGGMGPNLFGVYESKAAQKEKYRYSEYLKNAGIVWNREALTAWLSDRKTRQAYFGKEVNDTKMMWTGVRGKDKDAKMKAIIDYLATMK